MPAASLHQPAFFSHPGPAKAFSNEGGKRASFAITISTMTLTVNFISLIELRKQYRNWSNCFYLCFIFVLVNDKRILHFQFTGGNSPFWNLENVLFPEGSCESSTESGPIVFTYALFLCKETYIGLSIYRKKFAFLRPWNCPDEREGR